MNRLRGWYAFVREVLTGFGEDEASTYAASIAYYAFLSIFPLLLGIVSIFGFFLQADELREDVSRFLAGYLPQAQDVLSKNLQTVRETSGLAGLIAIAGFLWSGKAVFGAINAGLNRIWNVRDKRPIWLQTLIQLAMAIGLGLLFLLSLAATALLRMIADLEVPVFGVQLGEALPGFWQIVSYLVPIFTNFGVFALLYRFVPNTRVAWQEVWPAALFAALAFEVAKNLFLWYALHFGNYNAVYGSLGAVVALLAWAYLGGAIILLGAEISAVRAARRHTAGDAVEAFRPAA